MILKAYNFKISHIAGKDNVIADFLSCKPINSIRSTEDETSDNSILFIKENETVTAECVIVETRKDKVLRQVMQYIRPGWNNNPSSKLLPYFQRRYELTIENDMLLWGEKVIIPELLREILLKELHGEHLGIFRSKQLARIYLWWPKLDNDLENMVKVCQKCQEHSKNPKASKPGTWSWPTGPWKRLHTDYLGPDKAGFMYLVVVDAYSKYLEIRIINE